MRTGVMTALMTVIFLVAGCALFQTGGSQSGIRLACDGGALSGFIAPVKETFAEESGVPIVVVESKPGSELSDLQAGRVDAVVSSVPIDTLVQEAARAGHPAGDKTALQQISIGKNETVIFMHRGTKVRKLTKKQLKEIFTGRITNWKKVGGPNRHIVVVWNSGAEGENDAFVREVLHGEPVVATFHTAATAEEVRNKVLQTPGAVGIGPNALVTPGVRVPKSPRMTSSVIFITKGEPSAKVQKLIDLLKDVELIP